MTVNRTQNPVSVQPMTEITDGTPNTVKTAKPSSFMDYTDD